jgi:CheY-like chemotaxis protein
VAPSGLAVPPPLRVLAADDDGICRAVMAATLRKLGVAATVVADGAAAVAAFAAARGAFDIVFLDWHMPHLDGLQATRAMVGLGAALGSPAHVHVLTAATAPEDVATVLAAGAKGHLCKPMAVREISALLAQRREALAVDAALRLALAADAVAALALAAAAEDEDTQETPLSARR